MSSKHHGLMPFKGLEHLCHHQAFIPGRFARLFHQLPALYIDPQVLHTVGAAGGKLQDKGAPDLAKRVPAGLAFFGQFVDHDVTLDDATSLSTNNDPVGTENVRTPTLDLDCVYGEGPGGHPYLYDGAKLLTGADYASDASDPRQWDLPRSARGTAIIGDPRNDENRVISQMQLGFLRFHNGVVDRLQAQGQPASTLFERAREVTRWHYQWVVTNEFLRTVCGSWVVDDILANGRKVYQPEKMGVHEPFIPIEFAAAAYRFGHTMIPQKFAVQPGGMQHDVFGATLGLGFAPVQSVDQTVDWQMLLNSGNNDYQRAGRIDARLAASLLDLPFMPPGTPAPMRSLAVRNLLRGQSFLLPSGEQVAQHMMACGADEITPDMVAQVRQAGDKLGLATATPLWLYLLAEGGTVGRLDERPNGQFKFSKGEGLGPVGARLVAEVLIGLMELDHRAYLGANRNWSPADDAALFGGTAITSLYQMMTLPPA